MSKKPKDNTVGPWAEKKLDSLRRGLDYYTTRLKKTPYWKKFYVDAFAGPGLSKVRKAPKERDRGSAPIDDLFPDTALPDPIEEEVRYLKGSPRIALELKNPFDHYIFVEKDRQRRDELTAMASEYGETRSIDVRSGDASTELRALLKSEFKGRSYRAYVFLDPFGVQVPWEIIEALAATAAIEVMINFPLAMAIRRMMPRRGLVPEGWGISLDTFFGSHDWYEHAYSGELDLAGDPIKRDDSEPRLLEWYRERLKTAFGHVSAARLINNTRGNALYYLIWAGPHPAGLKGANYIMTMDLDKPKQTKP